MATEIERKFLVKNELWRQQVVSETTIKQGYLCRQENATVRVRVAGDSAWINIKSATQGISRLEYEYPIPVADAEGLLERVAEQPFIDKTRYQVKQGGHLWDLDVFRGRNQGLVVAELELAAEDESFEVPPWAGEEVSDDPRYYNANLVKQPYCDW